MLTLLALTLISYSANNKATQSTAENTTQSTTKRFDITLSDAAQKAVDNGVALTFVCEFANLKKFAFIPWITERKQHRFVLTHHALSNRYIVRLDKIQTPNLFRSLAHAVDFMTEQAMELFDSHNEHSHQHHMRISLSKYELPGPMRLNAFISNEWDLDSGWIEWVSEN